MSTVLDGCEVLLVENEALILMDLTCMLEDAGARVTSAMRVCDGLEAAAHSFDTAILDVRLADGDVFPVADQLVNSEVPIIFHSGHAQVDELHEQYPTSTVLSKPVREHDLISAVLDQTHKRGSEA